MAKVLVVGSGVAGIQASIDLADFGHHVFLVEQQTELGGNLRNLSEITPTGEKASDLLSNLANAIQNNKESVTVLKDAAILDLKGEFPEFKVTLKQSDDEKSIEVNTIILATGFVPYDPSPLKQYGYGKYEDVITSIELEKLVSNKKIQRPSDLKRPTSISIIQCVGSRDAATNTYCSSFCCLYAIKLARQIKEMCPEAEITVFYMDIRTPYIGEFDYTSARLLGIRFLRGKPARVTKMSDTLTVQVEDTLENDLRIVESDLVVLSVGGVPHPSTGFFNKKLGVELSATGFFEPSELPVTTKIKGVFIAGAASGPKDITYSMTQGSCAAAKAEIILRSIT